MKIPTLQQIQDYHNQSVILNFHHKNQEHTLEKVQEYFQDLLAFLWLSHSRKIDNKTTRMFGPLLILDEIWHTFILHTQDYHAFCQDFFGEYFHHEVEPLHQEHVMEPDELADFLEDCFTHLGEEWVDRYFSHLYHL